MATFISPPVGTSFTIGANDPNAISANIWSVKTNNTDSTPAQIYVYKWDGSTLTLFKTLVGPNFNDTNIDQTNFALTSTDNSSPITVNPTDRIVAIVTLNNNGAKVSGGSNIGILFDSSARAASQITLKYPFATANRPALSDTKDDDFTTAAATTACTTGGVAYNTKWTCLSGSAANSVGAFNAEDAAAAGSGDSSSWLWLRSQFTGGGTPSDFGTTPSNTFLYQTTDAGYGDGNVTTVVNSTMAYTVSGSNPGSPYSHAGLVLWSSNTDFYEIQVYADANKGSANTAHVAFVTRSGATITFVDTENINSTVSNGEYNQIWLQFQNSDGSYQAAYSLDGSNFIPMGSPQAHANFARAGLNVLNGISGLASAYSGAFEYFDYGFVVPGTIISGTVRSNPIDTGAGVTPAFNSIMWNGTAGTGKVRFQVASAPTTAGPFSFVGGATCSAADWYDPGGPGIPADISVCADSQGLNNNRYFEYLVQLCSKTDCTTLGTTSPIVTGIVVNWSP